MRSRRLEPSRPNLLARGLSYLVDAWLQARNPREAEERRFWRENGWKFSAMAAGSTDRALANWNPSEGDANAVTLEDLPKVRARARDAALNDPIAQAVRRTMADHVIGRGLKPQCLVDYEKLGITEQQAQDWQGACEAYFEHASKSADVTGRVSMPGLQRLIYLSIWDGGDVFPSFPMTRDPDNELGTRVNLIEAERVDVPPGMSTNPSVLGGVEVDDWGRPIAFHVYRGHPGDARPQRDRARFEYWPVRKNGRLNVMQLYHQERIGQARGIPGFAAALPLLDAVSDYVDENVLGARVQNALSIWITTQGDPAKVASAMSNLTSSSADTYYKDLKERGVVAGSINTLRRGDEAKFLGPSTPGQYFDPFLVRLLRIIASCIGAPYEVLFCDTAAANYSSIRAAFQSFKKTIAAEQDMVIPCLDAYWAHVIHEAWLDGKLGKDFLKIPFEEDPSEWARVTWIRPAPGYIDPTKEMAAYQVAVDNGFTSRTQVVAEGGGNFHDVAQQLAQEAKELKELGVQLGAAAKTAAAAGAKSDPAGDSAEPSDTGDAQQTEDSDKAEEAVTK